MATEKTQADKTAKPKQEYRTVTAKMTPEQFDAFEDYRWRNRMKSGEGAAHAIVEYVKTQK